MIRNYIKTALRSLLKNKGYSFLNIFGLAIGIACAALIFLWVEDEVNFDAVNAKKESLYIVKENLALDTRIFTHSSTPGPLGPSMLTDIPGVANTCRTTEGSIPYLFAVGERTVFSSGAYAEPSLFSMFTLPFVQGNAATAFAQVHSLVVTQKTAIKLFGSDQNVIGKTVRVDNKQEYIVSAVLKDLPANSTLQFEWLMPFKLHEDRAPWLKSWGNNSIKTYVELKPGASVDAVNKQLYGYVQKTPAYYAKPYIFICHERLAFIR